MREREHGSAIGPPASRDAKRSARSEPGEERLIASDCEQAEATGGSARESRVQRAAAGAGVERRR